MTPEEHVEHLKEMPRIRKICTACEHSGMGLEFQGAIPEQICKLARLEERLCAAIETGRSHD